MAIVLDTNQTISFTVPRWKYPKLLKSVAPPSMTGSCPSTSLRITIAVIFISSHRNCYNSTGPILLKRWQVKMYSVFKFAQRSRDLRVVRADEETSLQNDGLTSCRRLSAPSPLPQLRGPRAGQGPPPVRQLAADAERRRLCTVSPKYCIQY